MRAQYTVRNPLCHWLVSRLFIRLKQCCSQPWCAIIAPQIQPGLMIDLEINLEIKPGLHKREEIPTKPRVFCLS
jgi:hypothetical protein